MPLQAQDAYLEASNVEGVTDYSLLARLYNHLGSLYLYQDVYEKAIDFLRKAYFYYEKIEHQNGLSSVQVNMARAFHGLGAIDSAQYYYERLLPLAQGTRIRTLPSELGDLYREQGAMDKVYPLMQLALEWQPKEEKRAPIYLALGEYFLSVHQLDSADLYFRRAMMPTASIYTIAQCHRNRYRLQKELGRPKEALRHLEQFSAYADSISAMTHEASIRKVDAFYNYQRMQKQVAEAQLNAAKSRNLNYLMCLVALAVIFALSLIFLAGNGGSRRQNGWRIKGSKPCNPHWKRSVGVTRQKKRTSRANFTGFKQPINSSIKMPRKCIRPYCGSGKTSWTSARKCSKRKRIRRSCQD